MVSAMPMKPLSVSVLKNCRICNGDLQQIYEFARVPLVNDYCTDEPHEDAYYPLTLMQCQVCGLAQLKEEVPASLLYNRDYAYIPSTSTTLVEHFDQLAQSVMLDRNAGTKVMDVGSNDGTLLAAFQRRGCDVTGIEPARNLAERAKQNNIYTLGYLFNEKLVQDWDLHGFDVITATNVIANAHDMKGVLRGIRAALKDDGVFVMETPNLLKLMEIGSYDSIYHEHMAYFTPRTIQGTLAAMGFEVLYLDTFPIHGETLRVTAQKTEPRMVASYPEHLEGFGRRVVSMRHKLAEFLEAAHREGKRVVGYGAPAKATVLLHEAGVKREWIEYVTDSIPYKQGLKLPGLHIPIREPGQLGEPDYILVLCWNFRDEVLGKLSAYKGRIVFPIPELEVM